jgi:hypothetical protein
MAQIYDRVNGKKLEKLIALTREAQDGLEDETRKIAMEAEARLAAHYHSGDARIEVESGDVDRYVVLSDERGQKAAMSIEYGRQPDDEGKGGMEGLFILHKAAGLKGRD